ncbi:hypothetical protein [Stenoxybacter acetivorans]|uniref:hypothetical protein n=1 Tax=Stenoxybacter acetivorans TaxID=422441 RepID=UPI0005619150|nr:hypothetical protein [Stenoxybacter acetivorans]
MVYGYGGGSFNAQAGHQSIDSDYASVNEQTGIYAGDGGFNIKVNGTTDLQGAVIASTANKDKNSLITGELKYSDLNNHAEYQAVGGSAGIGSAPPPSASYQSGDADSTTKAAISEATIIIDGKQATDAQLAGLSRDTEHANQVLKPIFDLQKVQDNMALAQVVSEIVSTIATTTANVQKEESWQQRDEALKALEDTRPSNGKNIAERLTTATTRNIYSSNWAITTPCGKTTNRQTSCTNKPNSNTAPAALTNAPPKPWQPWRAVLPVATSAKRQRVPPCPMLPTKSVSILMVKSQRQRTKRQES